MAIKLISSGCLGVDGDVGGCIGRGIGRGVGGALAGALAEVSVVGALMGELVVGESAAWALAGRPLAARASAFQSWHFL